MRWIPHRAPASERILEHRRRSFHWVLSGTVLVMVFALGGDAQMTQPPNRAPKPLIVPEANPMPDANDQMEMRMKSMQTRNFNLANAERLRQMIKASDIIETMAIALKVEADQLGPPSETEIQKLETIEKLAHSVKEKMTITISAT